MSLAATFDLLGQKVMPRVAAAVFPDTADILEFSLTPDGSGGFAGAEALSYPSVPVSVEAKAQTGRRDTAQDSMTSTQEYEVSMPTHDISGERIALDPARHRIRVRERGTQDEKTLRILSVRDNAGVSYTALCVREDS